MASFGLPKEMKYPGGGDNAGDLMDHANTDPAMPGPRVTKQAVGETKGASITEGYAYNEEIHSVTPADIGADTIGGGQVHAQHPKYAAGRGTRFG